MAVKRAEKDVDISADVEFVVFFSICVFDVHLFYYIGNFFCARVGLFEKVVVIFACGKHQREVFIHIFKLAVTQFFHAELKQYVT